MIAHRGARFSFDCGALRFNFARVAKPVHHDVAILRRERARRRLANAASRTGDQRCFTFQHIGNSLINTHEEFAGVLAVVQHFDGVTRGVRAIEDMFIIG